MELSTLSPSGLVRAGWLVSGHAMVFSTFSNSCSEPRLWRHVLSREMCSCSSFDRNGLCHKAANLCSSLAPLLLQPFGAKPLLGYLWRVWVPGQHTWELCPITAEGQWQNLFTWVRTIHQAHTVKVVSWGSPASAVTPSLLIHGKTHLHEVSPKTPFRGQSFLMDGLIVCFQNMITCILKPASHWLASCENKFQS